MKTRLVLAVLAVVALSLAVTPQRIAPGDPDAIPGIDTLKYDDGSRYKKICYTASGVGKGWGALYYLPSDCCAWVTEVQVNLCPPEIDGIYKAEVVVLQANVDGSPGAEVARKEYDVRIGEWWHYVVLDAKVQVGTPGFYVFSYAKTYPQYMYQWFDQYDDAPVGTQFFFDGTNYVPFNSVGYGDIGVRAVIEAHDVQTTAIVAPLGNLFVGQGITPAAYIRNGTDLWSEPGVDVRYWITPAGGGAPVYDEVLTVNFPPNTTPFIQTFPAATVNWAPGNYVVACSTRLGCDYSRWNDKALGNVRVELKDAAAVSVDAPIGAVATGTVVSPKGTVKNAGTVAAAFSARYVIKNAGGTTVYDKTKPVPSLAPGATYPVTFDNWTATPAGNYTVQLTVTLAGDANPANDAASGAFQVVAVLTDAGVTQILSPTGTINRNRTYPLKVQVKNFGSQTVSFAAKCRLTRPDGRVFNYSKNVNNLAAGATADVQFANRRYPQVGTWTVVSWTTLSGDMNVWNDTAKGSFVSAAVFGWQPISLVPNVTIGKVAKGAALAADGQTYWLIKGKKDPQLYGFTEEIDGLPLGAVQAAERGLGDGANLVYFGGKLYLLNGNRSAEFRSYDVGTGVWTLLASVPAGLDDKLPKAGAVMVAAQGKLYTLKGGSTNEFYAYDPATNAWQELAMIPGKAVKNGAALCVRDGRLFAFKGGSTNEFYTYDIGSNVWQQLAVPPVSKVKVGARLACVNGVIYATVGGGKMDFYSYDVATNTWTKLDDVPLETDRRRVRTGAAMVELGDIVLFLKGAKAECVLCYQPAEADRPGPSETGAMGEAAGGVQVLTVSPNPASGIAKVSLPVQSGSVRLYSSAGQLVAEAQALRGICQFDVSRLVSGVYVVSSGDSQTRLVVQH